MRQRVALLLFAVASLTATAQQLPYQNPLLTAEQRADDLLSRLTLEEKAKLMMNESPAIERLGIPQFEWWNDALLERIFDAASDEARVKAQQAKRRGQIKRYQSLSFWTPNINIFRDPRCRRILQNTCLRQALCCT